MIMRIVLTVLMLASSIAGAEERIALVVGNGNYASVSALQNPVSDASLMTEALTEIGFKVTTLIDADQITMKRAIAQFGRDLRSAGSDATGLFYYAGHDGGASGVPCGSIFASSGTLEYVLLQLESIPFK